MGTLMDAYDSFSVILTESAPEALAGMDFRTLCRRLRVSPAGLDGLLMEELGYDGSEILHIFQNLLDL